MDFRIPYDQGTAAFNAAQMMGVPSKLVIFPDECHWVIKPQNALFWHREYFDSTSGANNTLLTIFEPAGIRSCRFFVFRDHNKKHPGILDGLRDELFVTVQVTLMRNS